MVRVAVRDSGLGIEPGSVQIIFDKFRQLGDTLTDKPRGSGLGLPICKEIVEHLGGRIGVDSAPGRGSTFWFTVPAARPEDPAAG
jgi:signal transduction histidine kinase